MTKRLSIILCLTCLMDSIASSQTLVFDDHIGIEDGLSNNFILDLTIDKRGYVWVATESGLNRIAGNTVTTYNKDLVASKMSSLISNETRSLYYSHQTDKLLIGLEKGLSIYDCKNATFTNITKEDGLTFSGINDITEASDGGAWLMMVNGAIQHIDCSTHQLNELKQDSLYSNRCGYDDGNGHFYVGHIHDGLSIIDLKSGKTRHLRHQAGDPTSLPGDNVRCIYQDKMKNVWIGTNHGLALLDTKKLTFKRVVHSDGSSDDNVFCIRQMSNGLLGIACDMGGISFIDLNKAFNGQTQLQFSDDITIQLSSINTRSILEDEFGNIWVGNHSTGVDFVSARKSAFNTLDYRDESQLYKRIYGITTDEQDNIWLGGEDELTQFRGTQFVRSWRISQAKHRKHSFAMCLMADHNDNIWMGMEDEGVIRFNTRTQQFERIDIGYSAPDIRSLYEDTDGTVWIGSEYGVFTYKDGKVTEGNAINTIIKREVISTILRLSDTQILFATLGKGAFIINTTDHTHIRLTPDNGMPSYSVNNAILDSHGSLWLATYEGLVYIPDLRQPDKMSVYDRSHGLADNHIRALQQDRTGRIWVSTYIGISCFDPKKEHFYNYDHRNNLPSGSFISGSVATLSDGTMLFGSPNGVCYFSPQSINGSISLSKAQITLCEAYNPAGEDTEILNLMPDEGNRVYANYKQNTLKIAFTVRDYSQVGNVEYSYKMKGMNDKWYYIGNDNDVVFRGLQPGNYTFILRAKLKNQDWEEASVTQFDIRIAPPFWQSWWAYLIYMLLAASIVWYLIRNYKNKLRLESSLELERRENVQKQELNEERLRFFTNITHELRTPLTLILGPLEDLSNDRRMPEVYHKKVELIFNNAQRLSNLINDILNFRKVETQNKRLTVAKGDLGALVREIGESYKQLNSNPKVAFYIIIRPDIPPLYFDSEIITIILNNFLSNAVKYTREGKISLIMNTDDKGQVCLSVQDTGYGISSEALPHIFERYYQAKGPHQASGTGIGLSLVKSLADLHEGRLSVVSEPDKGSTFTFSLLIGNSYPNALHKEGDAPNEKGRPTAEPATILMDNDQRPLLLVVEDNNDIRQYIAEAMGDDYRIIQAADGIEGTMLAMEQVPDIIVSDIMMPRMNGIQLTQRVKEDIRTSHIPVILLTAKDSQEDMQEGFDSGADSYLAKPFSAKLLQSRIHNLLASRHRMAELIAFQNTNAANSEPQLATADDNDTPRLCRLDQEFINKMNKVIDEHVTSEELNMDFMSDKMNMSYSTFYRKVKALTGQTAKDYIRKRRLQKSAELLKSGDYNVTEAATMTGFNDLNNFRIIFKKEFGVTPSEYKDTHGHR